MPLETEASYEETCRIRRASGDAGRPIRAPALRVVNLANTADPERRSPRRCTYSMSGCPGCSTARKAARAAVAQALVGPQTCNDRGPLT